MSEPRTLVTGASGFAGSHLLDRLGHSASLIAWHRPGHQPPDGYPHVRWQGVDIVNGESVRTAIRDSQPERVYHLAGAPNVETSWQNAVPHMEINVLGTHNLLESIRTIGRPCRILVVSSAQIYQPSDEPIHEDMPLVPSNPYGLTKLAQDQLALRAHVDDGLNTVVARAFNHIGPRQATGFAVSSFARQIARIEAGLASPVLRVGNLDAWRDFTDVRDVADAYVALMDRGRAGRAYNVCSGQAWQMSVVLEALRQLSTAEVLIETDPDRLRPNDVPVFQGDAARIGSEAGWKAQLPFEQTLRDTLDWWRASTRAEL